MTITNYQILNQSSSLSGYNIAGYYSGKWYVAVAKFDESAFDIYSSSDAQSWGYETTLARDGGDTTIRWHGFNIDGDGKGHICYSTSGAAPGTKYNRTTTVITSSWTWAGWSNDPLYTYRTRFSFLETAEYGGVKYIHLVQSILNGSRYSIAHAYSTNNGATWIGKSTISTAVSSSQNSYSEYCLTDSVGNLWVMGQDYTGSLHKFGMVKWTESTQTWGSWQYLNSPSGNKTYSWGFFIDSSDNVVAYFIDTITNYLYFTYGINETQFDANRQDVLGAPASGGEVVCVEFGTDIPIALYEDGDGQWYRSYITSISPYTFKAEALENNYGHVTTIKGYRNQALIMYQASDADNDMSSLLYTGYMDAVSHLGGAPPAGSIIKRRGIQRRGLRFSKLQIGGI